MSDDGHEIVRVPKKLRTFRRYVTNISKSYRQSKRGRNLRAKSSERVLSEYAYEYSEGHHRGSESQKRGRSLCDIYYSEDEATKDGKRVLWRDDDHGSERRQSEGRRHSSKRMLSGSSDDDSDYSR